MISHLIPSIWRGWSIPEMHTFLSAIVERNVCISFFQQTIRTGSIPISDAGNANLCIHLLMLSANLLIKSESHNATIHGLRYNFANPSYPIGSLLLINVAFHRKIFLLFAAEVRFYNPWSVWHGFFVIGEIRSNREICCGLIHFI